MTKTIGASLMRLTENAAYAEESSYLEKHLKMRRPVFEYRYRYSTGGYEIRVRRDGNKKSGWIPLREFTGQTYSELKVYIMDHLGPTLLAERDVE